MRPRATLALGGAALLVTALSAPVAAQEPTVEVLAEGLNAPRGLDIAPDGSVYVAEAGAAGETCMDEAAGGMCYGPTGAITRIADGNVEKIVEGLTSAGAGPEIGGVSDVTVAEDGSLTFLMNLGADPAVREGMPAEFATAGWLLTGPPDAPVTFADVAAFESANDPDAALGGEVDSNPYALESIEDGYLVADAGGNTLLKVAQDGTVSLVATIPFTTHQFSVADLAAMGPPPEGEGAAPAESGAPAESMAAAPAESMAAAPAESMAAAPAESMAAAPAESMAAAPAESMAAAPAESMAAAPAESGAPPADAMVDVPVQSVPTSVAVGPDGAYYVGELTGGPFPVGGAKVWRVVPGEEPTEYASGFTNTIGIGFAPDGTLYVAEIAHDGLMPFFMGTGPAIGAVLAVPPGGGEAQVVATGEQFMALGGLAVDDAGAVYVSANTLAPGAGTVLKITP